MTSAPSLKQVAAGDLAHELATTRRVLERVPEEHFGWKPHEKSMSLAQLAGHLANLLSWQCSIVEDDFYDVTAAPPSPEPPATRDELLRTFDANRETLLAAFERLEDADLSRPWSLKQGDRVIFSQPRGVVLRNFGINHMVHHRGQMSVYLRLLDVPVPAIYGPSADEASPA
ncbi:DinB family protein [Rhodocaloribacter sp.]